MTKRLKRYVEQLTDAEYREKGLRPLRDSLVSPSESLSLSETILDKRIQHAYNRYARWASNYLYDRETRWESDCLNNEIPWWGKLWAKNPSQAYKVTFGPKTTTHEARLGAEKIAVNLIELLERDPTRLNRRSIELWLRELQTSARPEANWKDFSEHVRLELGIFESSGLDTDLKAYLVHIEPFQNLRRYSYQLGDGTRKYSYQAGEISPWSQEDRELERDFYKSLGLESQSDVGRFHIVLFRRDFFEALLVPIVNFPVDKNN